MASYNSQPTVQGVTADAEIQAERGNFYGVTVITDGANPAEVTVYNGAIAAGKKMARIKVPAATLFGGVILPCPTAFATLRVVVTGTGAEAILYHGR